MDELDKTSIGGVDAHTAGVLDYIVGGPGQRPKAIIIAVAAWCKKNGVDPSTIPPAVIQKKGKVVRKAESIADVLARMEEEEKEEEEEPSDN